MRKWLYKVGIAWMIYVVGLVLIALVNGLLR